MQHWSWNTSNSYTSSIKITQDQDKFSSSLFHILDLMVKKNLVYVNSEELDEMDILTTDLDQPAHELRIEVSRPNPA